MVALLIPTGVGEECVTRLVVRPYTGMLGPPTSLLAAAQEEVRVSINTTQILGPAY